MHKELLSENKELLSEILTDLKQFKPHLEEVKRTYEKLELGNFTNDVLKVITTKNINEIDKQYFEKCESDFSILNVSNALIKDNLMKGSHELFNEFLTASNNLRKFRPETYSRSAQLKPAQISFENETFFCSELDQENILEVHCRIYIETDKEKKLLESLTNLKQAFDVIFTDLESMNFDFRGQFKNMASIERLFFMCDHHTGQIEVNAGGIKYASQFEKREL